MVDARATASGSQWTLPPDLAEGLSPMRLWGAGEAYRIARGILAGESVKVWLVGDYAEGTVDHYSHIEIVVEVAGAFEEKLISALTEALEESSIPYFSEVRFVRASDIKSRAELMKTGILWPMD